MPWIERETCYLSLNQQGSVEWKQERLCRIPASKIGAVCGLCIFNAPDDRLARILCGLEEEIFDETAIKRMARGHQLEPKLRAYDSHKRGVEIIERGVAVFKKDPRFCGSMDGDIDDTMFVEYKTTQKMYAKLVRHIARIKAGEAVSGVDHIFKTHYAQITAVGVITGKKYCGYTVYSVDDGSVYQETIEIDYTYWEEFLYPTACLFYDEYMQPLIDDHSLTLVQPTVE